MHLTIKERVELVLMSGADGVCYYYLNCFICFGALFMAQNVCYYYLNCFICFGALFMATLYNAFTFQMCMVSCCEVLKYNAKHIQFFIKVRASNDAFGSCQLL